jgi:hypothetical protein
MPPSLFRLARCRCPECGRDHADLIRAAEAPLVEAHALLCDPCFEAGLPPAKLVKYRYMKDACREQALALGRRPADPAQQFLPGMEELAEGK